MNDNTQNYTAVMMALGRVSKVLGINLVFDGQNYDEIIERLVLESRAQINDSWLDMFEGVLGKRPQNVLEASQHLNAILTPKPKKAKNKKILNED
jgi:hypothetical protein